MKRLLSIRETAAEEIERIFTLAHKIQTGSQPKLKGFSCAYSFEGSGIRTRSTFLKALAHLEMTAIELPNLLKSKEERKHMAGYLDQWIDIYIIREQNHEAIENFAQASARPVVNAMSAKGHPCEVLSDAFSLRARNGGLEQLRFCIVGPPTNVLNSWTELCEVLGLDYVRVMPAQFIPQGAAHRTPSLQEGLHGADVVLTDSWPESFNDLTYQVTRDKLRNASKDVIVIPCPLFNTSQEVSQDVIDPPHFAGYEQKRSLYVVQMAVIATLLSEKS